MEFAHPNILWALVVIVPLAACYVWRTLKGGSTIDISTVEGVSRAPKTVRWYLRHLPFVLRCAAVALIVVALARPQSAEHNTRTDAEGIDIVMALDVSTSMLARDFNPDRITAAKEVAAEFIADRISDRIGLVVFAGESLTQSPLTTDRATLQTLLARVRSGLIEDGTAIGNGLATAINRLRESDAKSKVVILLTDGSNNRGDISPMTAAEIAKSLGIRVYTVGVGSNKVAPYPMPVAGGVQYVNIPVEIDNETLRGIAKATDGDFYRATNTKELNQIYKEIDQLEKSKLNVKQYSKKYDVYQPFALVAVLALLLELLLRITVFRRIP